jgi:hypothetical protein
MIVMYSRLSTVTKKPITMGGICEAKTGWRENMPLKKIVSGGQTGADIAAFVFIGKFIIACNRMSFGYRVRRSLGL